MCYLAVSLAPTLMSDIGKKGWTSLGSFHNMSDPVLQQAANLQWQDTLQPLSPVASSSLWLPIQVQLVSQASLSWALFPSLAIREPYKIKFEGREEAFFSVSEATSLQHSSLWEHPATACSSFKLLPIWHSMSARFPWRLCLLFMRAIWSLSLGSFRNIKLFGTTPCCLRKIVLHILSISE